MMRRALAVWILAAILASGLALAQDGLWIFYEERGADGSGALFRARPDGSERSERVRYGALQIGQLSPSGDRVPYTDWDGRLVVLDLKMGSKVIDGFIPPDSEGARAVPQSWSPDGCCLLFTLDDGTSTLHPLWMLDLGKMQARLLVPEGIKVSGAPGPYAQTHSDVAWSPGGDKLLFARGGGMIEVMDVATRSAVLSFRTGAADDEPTAVTWSPTDPDLIAFGVMRAADLGAVSGERWPDMHVYIADVAERAILSDMAGAFFPVWSPDGEMVAAGMHRASFIPTAQNPPGCPADRVTYRVESTIAAYSTLTGETTEGESIAHVIGAGNAYALLMPVIWLPNADQIAAHYMTNASPDDVCAAPPDSLPDLIDLPGGLRGTWASWRSAGDSAGLGPFSALPFGADGDVYRVPIGWRSESGALATGSLSVEAAAARFGEAAARYDDLGIASAPPERVGDGWIQLYPGAALLAGPTGAIRRVGGVLWSEYEAPGGPAGALAVPTGDAARRTAAVTGTEALRQDFEGGALVLRAESVIAVPGPFADAWAGSESALGWPTGPADDASQDFEGGVLARSAPDAPVKAFTAAMWANDAASATAHALFSLPDDFAPAGWQRFEQAGDARSLVFQSMLLATGLDAGHFRWAAEEIGRRACGEVSPCPFTDLGSAEVAALGGTGVASLLAEWGGQAGTLDAAALESMGRVLAAQPDREAEFCAEIGLSAAFLAGDGYVNAYCVHALYWPRRYGIEWVLGAPLTPIWGARSTAGDRVLCQTFDRGTICETAITASGDPVPLEAAPAVRAAWYGAGPLTLLDSAGRVTGPDGIGTYGVTYMAGGRGLPQVITAPAGVQPLSVVITASERGDRARFELWSARGQTATFRAWDALRLGAGQTAQIQVAGGIAEALKFEGLERPPDRAVTYDPVTPPSAPGKIEAAVEGDKLVLSFIVPEGAAAYAVRYATYILSESTWASAQRLRDAPAAIAPGERQRIVLDFPRTLDPVYFGVKAVSLTGVAGPLAFILEPLQIRATPVPTDTPEPPPPGETSAPLTKVIPTAAPPTEPPPTAAPIPTVPPLDETLAQGSTQLLTIVVGAAGVLLVIGVMAIAIVMVRRQREGYERED